MPEIASSGEQDSVLFQVGLTRTEVLDGTGQGAAEFRRCSAVRCEELLEPALLARVQAMCDTGGWISDPCEPGHRELESPQRAGRLLNLALSRPVLLRWLEETTGCGPLARVEGTVAQTFPRPGDELDWHDDAPGEGRRLAMVILLGTEPYEGGEFELRRKGETAPLTRHKHTRAGSGLFFRVSEELEHRVLPLRSGGPRRVFAGWAFAARAGR